MSGQRERHRQDESAEAVHGLLCGKLKRSLAPSQGFLVQYNAEFIYLHETATSGDVAIQRVDYVDGVVTNGGNRSAMFVQRRVGDSANSGTLQFIFNQTNAFIVVRSECFLTQSQAQ